MGDAEGQRASAEHQQADAEGSSLTRRLGGLTQSLREVLERFSWSGLAEYLLPKRGITAKLISLSGEPVWHPVVLKKSCFIIKPAE